MDLISLNVVPRPQIFVGLSIPGQAGATMDGTTQFNRPAGCTVQTVLLFLDIKLRPVLDGPARHKYITVESTRRLKSNPEPKSCQSKRWESWIVRPRSRLGFLTAPASWRMPAAALPDAWQQISLLAGWLGEHMENARHPGIPRRRVSAAAGRIRHHPFYLVVRGEH